MFVSFIEIWNVSRNGPSDQVFDFFEPSGQSFFVPEVHQVLGNQIDQYEWAYQVDDFLVNQINVGSS